MAWWGWLLLAWLAVAVVLAVVLGRAIRTAERHELGTDRPDERPPGPGRADDRPWEVLLAHDFPVRDSPVHGGPVHDVPPGEIRPDGVPASCETPPGRRRGRTPRIRRRRAP